VTSPEPPGTARSTDVAHVEAALTAGRVTADEPQARAIQTFALALRGTQPPARPAFLDALDRWMQDELRPTSQMTVPEAVRRPIRVCVVEPHPSAREGLVSALDRDPAIEVVGQAGDAAAALDLAHRLKPDVMVLDLRLRGVRGLTVLERLRAELPEIGTVVMAGDESPESLIDAVAAGAAGYLSRCTSGEQLREAVITVYGGGTVIAPEVAGRVLRDFQDGVRASSAEPALSARKELEILRLVADGLTDDEIGQQLFISPRTVQNHLTRICAKTHMRAWWKRSRTLLRRWGMR
jgi:two-component system, NarL family, response regulator DevR